MRFDKSIVGGYVEPKGEVVDLDFGVDEGLAEVLQSGTVTLNVDGDLSMMSFGQASSAVVARLRKGVAPVYGQPPTPNDFKVGDEVVIVRPTNEMPGRSYLAKAVAEGCSVRAGVKAFNVCIRWEGRTFMVPSDAIVKMTPISDEQYRIDLALALATAVGDDLDRVGALLGVKRATQAPPIPADVRFD